MMDENDIISLDEISNIVSEPLFGAGTVLPEEDLDMAIDPAEVDAIAAEQYAVEEQLKDEFLFDFATRRFVLHGGDVVRVSEMDALAVWCANALTTIRLACDVYSGNFGIEAGGIIGFGGSVAETTSRIAESVERALYTHERIDNVRDIQVRVEGTAAIVSCVIDTSAGSIDIEGTVPA